ncbi:MAG TPA: hypothetical protein VFY31_07715, partial [Macromonas sp.]|nr:hypothetical protein [Macromonas sp.]
MTTTLPRFLEDLTPAWLTGALQARCPGVTVDHLDIEHVIWGTATKVLVNAQYSGSAAQQHG